jgi:hypothetical protein
MPVKWSYASDVIRLGGTGCYQIAAEDATRQEQTVQAILGALQSQPGVILADEVGMGKTYVALAVAASVLQSTRKSGRPVIVMMPPGLAAKWRSEWKQFKAICCTRAGDLDWVHDADVHRPTDLFRVLGAPHRPQLIWMTTNCFSRGLQDPWVKLGLIRLARPRTRMDEETKKKLYKWATSLVRLKSQGQLTPMLIEKLMETSLDQWRRILVAEAILAENDEPPISESLLVYQGELDWSWLTAVLRGESIPGRRGPVSSRRLTEARNEFNDACQDLYWQWLNKADWRSSLLILDEAHHAKNDSTRLASLFRSEDVSDLLEGGTDTEDRPLLWEKFDRMLFLTATPFQLGHHELIRVLRSFASARWRNKTAPAQSREQFLTCLAELERRLDQNRLAGRFLDRLWGRLTPAQIRAVGRSSEELSQSATSWWREVLAGTDDPFEQEIVRAVKECRRTKLKAERGEGDDNPWTSLRTWVIRHNRSSNLPRIPGQTRFLQIQVPRGVAEKGEW